MVAVHLNLMIALMIEAAGGARGDQAVAAGPQGEVGDRRLVGNARERRIGYRMLGDPFVELPHRVLARVAGEGGAKGDHRLDSIRVIAGELPCVEAAEAPADDDQRLVVAEALDPLA